MDVAIVGCKRECLDTPLACTYRKYAACMDTIQIPVKSIMDTELVNDLVQNSINDLTVHTITHADCHCEEEGKINCKLTTTVRIRDAHGGQNEP